MTRPLIATIDIAAMRHNLSVVKKAVPKAKVWAVVKADAYGHGLDRAVKAFTNADGLAMIEIESAVHVRKNGWNKPILLLEGFFTEDELPILSQYDLTTAVANESQLSMLENIKLSKPISVHLKINSGMNRLGFTPEQYPLAYQRLKKISWVRDITYMMHFANSEIDNHPKVSVTDQISTIDQATQGLPGERNLSNSAAILLHSNIHTDWVRPGIMLYGGTPGGKTAQEFGLLPAMTLTSKIIQIQYLKPGDSVGYGSLYTAQKPMTIGVVACGYADGYPRVAPETTPIIVDGVKTHLVGRVSMDMLGVDLTDVAGAHVGSQVTLWGKGLPIDEVAEATGTVGYELMCALSSRPKVIEID